MAKKNSIFSFWYLSAIFSGIALFIISSNITEISTFFLKTTNNLNKISDSDSLSEKHPLDIERMRNNEYLGSDLQIEETLEDGLNYYQYIVSYKSEGLKIYGLLTVPIGDLPEGGWPVILFNHGYIPPAQYKTTERYGSYVDNFARNGYIVFKSDYRGHGISEGRPEGAYYSASYTIDVLNALASLKKYKDANPEKIGMWGHSMGGNIVLRSLVVRPDDIKAAVIWGGVVGTYEDLTKNWRRSAPFRLSPEEQAIRNMRNSSRTALMQKYGSPSAASKFWISIDPNFYLEDIKVAIQIHTGSDDQEVPAEFSKGLFDRLSKINKVVEFYNYEGGDHNISDPNFSIAIKRSLDFFDKYLKP